MLRSLASALEVLSGDDLSDTDRSEVMAHLSGLTREFLRSAEMTLAAAGDMPQEGLEIMDMSAFFGSFAEKCEGSTGGRVHIRTGKTDNTPVLSSEDMLNYIFLCFIRKYAGRSGGMALHFELSCSRENESMLVSIVSDEELKAEVYDLGMRPELTDRYPDEMCMLLAKRIGAELKFIENGFTVRLPLADKQTDITLSSSRVTPPESGYSPFDIMLGDFRA